MSTVYDRNGNRIPLGREVGRGGEATVYRLPGRPDMAAKVFDRQAPSRDEGKLAWMVSHPPENPPDAHGHVSIAWPQELLYDERRRFVGYLLPYVRNAVSLLHVINPRLRARTLPDFDWRYLHRAARNLSAAVDAVHARGYVIGDVHDGNVLVTPGALVTLIDDDSFQVWTGDGRLYPCPVGRAEYTPPELQGRSFARVARTVEHDRFGLGVLIFQLLMGGSHPFRARWLGSGDPLPLEERIRRGCFPYRGTPPCPVAPPGNAPNLDVLHPSVGDLTRRCFADGHGDPGLRPTAAEWNRALVEAEQGLVLCPQGHYRAAHVEKCPRCALEREREERRARAIQIPAQPVTAFRPVQAPGVSRAPVPARGPAVPAPARRYPRWAAVVVILLAALAAALLGRAVWPAQPDAAILTPTLTPTPFARVSLQVSSVGGAGGYPVESLSLANLAQIDWLDSNSEFAANGKGNDGGE